MAASFTGRNALKLGGRQGAGECYLKRKGEGGVYYWRVDGMYCSGEGGKGWDRMAWGLTVCVVVYLADAEAKGWVCAVV